MHDNLSVWPENFAPDQDAITIKVGNDKSPIGSAVEILIERSEDDHVLVVVKQDDTEWRATLGQEGWTQKL